MGKLSKIMDPNSVDKIVFGIIEGMEEIPNGYSIIRELKRKGYYNIAKEFGVLYSPLKSKDEKLLKIILNKTKEILEKMSDYDLFRNINKLGWINGFPGEFRSIISERVSDKLVSVILKMEELPSARNICRELNKERIFYAKRSIERRMLYDERIKNAILKKLDMAMENKSDTELFGILSRRKSSGMPVLVCKINSKINSIILNVIEEMQEMPTPKRISDGLYEKGISYGIKSLYKRINSEEELRSAVENKTCKIIGNMSDSEFFRDVVQRRRGNVGSYIYGLIEKRIISVIMRTLLEERGDNTVKGIYRSLEKKGIRYGLNSLSEKIIGNKELLNIYSKKNNGVDNFILKRIKNGRSPHRNIKEIVEGTVGEFGVFRESFGMAQAGFFSDSRIKNVLEVSIYGRILPKALTTIPIGHFPDVYSLTVSSVVDSGIKGVDAFFDLAIISGVLHLTTERYRIFEEVNRSLKEGGRLIVTIPGNCRFSASALESISKDGMNISEEWRLSHRITVEAFEYLRYDNRLAEIAERNSKIILFEKQMKKKYEGKGGEVNRRISILDMENRQVRKNAPRVDDLNLAPEGLAMLLNYVFRKPIESKKIKSEVRLYENGTELCSFILPSIRNSDMAYKSRVSSGDRGLAEWEIKAISSILNTMDGKVSGMRDGFVTLEKASTFRNMLNGKARTTVKV